MLISLNRMIGMPVICQDQKIGYVERVHADLAAGRLEGMAVRKGIGWARWAAGEDVLLVGEKCVVLGRKPVQAPPKEEEDVRRVFLTTGECAGEVTDMILHDRSLRVAALEICQGPFYRLMGQRKYASCFYLNPAGEVAAMQLLSWTQLEKQLGEEVEE